MASTAFFDMFYRLYDDARSIGNVKIAAIGPATAQRIKDLHLAVDLQPKEFVAEAIVDGLLKLGSVENLKILVVRALGAREVLPKRLAELGAIVDEAIAYRTVPETNGQVRRSGKISSGGSGSDNLYQFVDGGQFSGAQASMAGENENGEHWACHLRNDAEAWPVSGCRGRTIRCGWPGDSGVEALCKGGLTVPDILILASMPSVFWPSGIVTSSGYPSKIDGN